MFWECFLNGPESWPNVVHDFSFSQMANLRAQLKIHSGFKTHKCNWCIFFIQVGHLGRRLKLTLKSSKQSNLEHESSLVSLRPVILIKELAMLSITVNFLMVFLMPSNYYQIIYFPKTWKSVPISSWPGSSSCLLPGSSHVRRSKLSDAVFLGPY